MTFSKNTVIPKLCGLQRLKDHDVINIFKRKTNLSVSKRKKYFTAERHKLVYNCNDLMVANLIH